MPSQHKRRLLIAATLALPLVGLAGWQLLQFPPDTRPEGAYMRIAASLGRNQPAKCFAYLDQDGQDAVFSIRSYAQQASLLIERRYPQAQQQAALDGYREAASSPDEAALWVAMAQRRGWLTRLRSDLSGVATVEIKGPRASITTARGTRYAFRQRANGMWGLTLFTAELLAEAERLARDLAVVKRAADDYAQATNSTH